MAQYEPLPTKNMIRLLRVDREASNEDVLCSSLSFTMYHAALQESTQYCALSYAWGAPVPPGSMCTVKINGTNVLVRPNLLAFLTTVSRHCSGMGLWVDALCISQENITERNHQVSIMGDIYGMARSVYVWLGIGDDDTNYALEHIEALHPKTPYQPRTFSMCAEKLFKASYWTRRWVIQELALARNPIIACGSSLTTWEKLLDMVKVETFDVGSPASQTYKTFKDIRLRVTEKRYSLMELIDRFQDARCADKRDTIFALRSIAYDGHLLQPDYEISIGELYFRFLSLSPMERFRPTMRGYLWPYEAVTQLMKGMHLSKDDILSSLDDHSTDRIYTVLEPVGRVMAVGKYPQNRPKHLFPGLYRDAEAWLSALPKLSMSPTIVKLQDGSESVLYGEKHLESGDLIYSLQTTRSTPTGLYVAFKTSPAVMSDDDSNQSGAGMLIEKPDHILVDHWKVNGVDRDGIGFVRQAIASGVSRCRLDTHNFDNANILCHISRRVLVVFWWLSTGQLKRLHDIPEQIPSQYLKKVLKCPCDVHSIPGPADPPNRWPSSRRDVFRPDASSSRLNQELYEHSSDKDF